MTSFGKKFGRKNGSSAIDLAVRISKVSNNSVGIRLNTMTKNKKPTLSGRHSGKKPPKPEAEFPDRVDLDMLRKIEKKCNEKRRTRHKKFVKLVMKEYIAIT